MVFCMTDSSESESSCVTSATPDCGSLPDRSDFGPAASGSGSSGGGGGGKSGMAAPFNTRVAERGFPAGARGTALAAPGAALAIGVGSA